MRDRRFAPCHDRYALGSRPVAACCRRRPGAKQQPRLLLKYATLPVWVGVASFLGVGAFSPFLALKKAPKVKEKGENAPSLSVGRSCNEQQKLVDERKTRV